MAKLILIRHGESEWNALGLWTGWTDIGLSEKGKEEARIAATAIKDTPFEISFTSKLKRAHQTLEIILKTLGTESQVIETEALNERNYGDYTGKNKWEIKKQLGEDEFLKLRRSWDYPIPNGESLKEVASRVFPYYQQEILPYLEDDKNVLLVAHGNSIRALIKQLEEIPDGDIASIEIKTGEAIIYTLDTSGKVLNKRHTMGNTNNTS